MNEYMEMYIAEAKELLDEMNGSLLMLDKNISDTGLINSIFRDIHTIKGNSASMGFKKMENLAHSMEDVLQDIREGKVEVDEKIMELLFVCHDFLESGISSIMQTGNEEDMNIDGVLNKLHLIIGEKHEKMKNESAAPLEKSLDGIDLTLNTQELYNLKKNIDKGYHAYLIKIKITPDCIFKSVRIWMWFQEIETYLKVIKSVPEKPTSNDIKNNKFIFDGNDLKLLAVFKEDSRVLHGKLHKLLDVENICLEPVKLKDSDFLKSQVKLVMTKAAISGAASQEEIEKNASKEAKAGDDEDRVIEIESELTNDFIQEITQQLTKLEEGIRSISEKPEYNNAFYKLSRTFHTIKGLAGFIDHRTIVRIADTAEQLMEYYRKGDSGSISFNTKLLGEAAVYIRKLCENSDVVDSKKLIDIAESFIIRMKNEIPQDEIQNDEKPQDEMSKNEMPENELPKNVIPKDKDAGIDVINELYNQAEQVRSQNAGKTLESSFMRISAKKIDLLVDMLGELIIMHSLILKEASDYFDSNDKYMTNLLRMSKIIKEVQNLSMSLRMVSLKQTLQKTMRVGRDTAAELGKKVNIDIQGEDTEIDRTIADKLVDPLMHLVRNSVSHGIEEEEERKKLGKPEEGQVCIRAYSKRGYVYIEVEDDGKGLSIEQIRAKAAQNNLLDPDLNYSAQDIMKFIFLPGFSTKEKVDNISGRGVGMNVVETEIKKVSGKVEIINNEGKGCTFTLKIPLNLAVMNGTVVEIRGGRYIIPTIYIKQFMKPDEAQWVKVKNKKTMLHVRDEIIQVIPIDKVFDTGKSAEEADETMVIIIEVEQKLKAIPVKSIIGRQEIVAKPLEKEFGGMDFISGASILGDGKVSLILDVESIFKIS